MNGITRIEAKGYVGAGWAGLIDRAYDVLETDSTVNVKQVKGKFGGLRIYVDGGNPLISDIILGLESESYRTCEDCGKPGTMVEVDGWRVVLCRECVAKESGVVVSL